MYVCVCISQIDWLALWGLNVGLTTFNLVVGQVLYIYIYIYIYMYIYWWWGRSAYAI